MSVEAQTTGVGQLTIDSDDAEEVRPFHIEVSDEDIADLRQRVAATRWPDRETVTDNSRACGWR